MLLFGRVAIRNSINPVHREPAESSANLPVEFGRLDQIRKENTLSEDKNSFAETLPYSLWDARNRSVNVSTF